MQGYVAGDQKAFVALFSRLGPRVYAFLTRSFPSAEAEDLLQVTFMKFHSAKGAFRQGMTVRPWLFTIANRVRLDALRTKYRDRAAEPFEDDSYAGGNELSSADELDVDERDLVKRAVDALPESQRIIVHLHRFEGLTFAEIAAALDLEPGAVRVRAFRAYDRLRSQLETLVKRDDL